MEKLLCIVIQLSISYFDNLEKIMKKILVMNGPNLNMLGIRETGVYGAKTLDEVNAFILKQAKDKDVELEFLNAGAYTHYSYAIRDAISSIHLPCVEVHLSDIHAREEFRHRSVISDVCIAQICGKGEQGYVDALNMLLEERI